MKWMRPSTAFAGMMQLMFFVGIGLGILSGAEWYWWCIALFFDLFVYSMVGNNIGLHRYFTHGHFKVKQWIEYLFAWCGSMIGIGDPISYAMTHLVHHNPKYTDTHLDPHGPARKWYSICMFFQRTIDLKETPVTSKRIVPIVARYTWLHNYYIPFILLNAGLLWMIDYKVMLFCWLIPASAACWGIGISVVRQHWPMGANNCPTHKWEPFYEALHKNHHDYPMAPNTAVHAGEIDWTYQFSRIFKPEYNFAGQPKK